MSTGPPAPPYSPGNTTEPTSIPRGQNASGRAIPAGGPDPRTCATGELSRAGRSWSAPTGIRRSSQGFGVAEALTMNLAELGRQEGDQGPARRPATREPRSSGLGRRGTAIAQRRPGRGWRPADRRTGRARGAEWCRKARWAFPPEARRKQPQPEVGTGGCLISFRHADRERGRTSGRPGPYPGGGQGRPAASRTSMAVADQPETQAELGHEQPRS